MDEGRLIAILQEHGVRLAELGAFEWGQIGEKEAGSGAYPRATEETVARIARVIAVNRTLRQHKGCEPLTLDDSKTEQPAAVEEEIDEGAAAVGLSSQEWDVVKGHHGTLLGLGLSRRAFECMMRRCRSKKALLLRGDEPRCKAYLHAELCKHAQLILHNQRRKPKCFTSSSTAADKQARALEKKAKALVRAAAAAAGPS